MGKQSSVYFSFYKSEYPTRTSSRMRPDGTIVISSVTRWLTKLFIVFIFLVLYCFLHSRVASEIFLRGSKNFASRWLGTLVRITDTPSKHLIWVLQRFAVDQAPRNEVMVRCRFCSCCLHLASLVLSTCRNSIKAER